MVTTYVPAAAFEQGAMSHFAETILRNKNYTHEKGGGRYESWPEAAERVVRSVMQPYLPDLVERTTRLVVERKFVPGGRYLYAAGRKYPQCNNCLAGDEEIVTDRGIFPLRELVSKSFKVLNRFGRWEEATAKAFGVQRLYRVRFKNGDEVLATANHRWWQADGGRVTTAELERAPLVAMEQFPALDEEGIRHGIVYGDGCVPAGAHHAHVLLCGEKKQVLASHFPQKTEAVTRPQGGTVVVSTHHDRKAGKIVNRQPAKYKQLPDPRLCTPEYARGFVAGLIATDGNVGCSVTISNKSRGAIEVIRKLAVLGGCVTTKIFRGTAGKNHINKAGVGPWIVRIKPFSAPLIRPDQIAGRDSRSTSYRRQMWQDVESIEDTGRVETVYCCVVPGSESFTLANGLVTSNCFLWICEEDSREQWAQMSSNCINSLMTGGGIGVVYSKLRAEDSLIGGLGGKSTGPCALMKIINEAGRYIRQGGSRRSAIWAGLHWNHPDIFKFVTLKDWPDTIRRCREEDFNFPAPMDGTNISVILDDDFFAAYEDENHPQHDLAANVYWTAVRHMLRTGEPGFSVDIGENAGENARNACCEVTSATNGDMCNLGSSNMGRLRHIDDFREVVECGTAFLLCGTLYSKLPIESMYRVREKNRRIGLGLMGVHEWLVRRGMPYGPNDELEKWMQVYEMSGAFANRYADRLGISRPVATRSIAPTGTISIIAETTSGIEPVYAVAYKRRYLEGHTWKAQYVIDPAAKRLIDAGVDPALIEDSYTLAEDVDRRVAFQAWLQQRVDHAISSTINLPPWGSSLNNENTVTQFGRRLLKHLPQLRGITAYPDGARGGQPLNRVSYTEAVKHVGKDFIEEAEEEYSNGASCKNGVCGE